jgi:alcohol dehydrogenase, propanol-preferring
MALRIIGIDHGSKEELVKDCGAEAFLDVTKFDDKTLTEEVKKITGGLGASAVIVCTASNGAYAQALGFLRFGGTLVCVGMPEGDPKPISNAFPAEMVMHNSARTLSSLPAQHRLILIQKSHWLTCNLCIGSQGMEH